MKHLLIAYDVSCSRVRYRIVRLLENIGIRIQYSVFECRVSTGDYFKLKENLESLIETTDRINYFSLCKSCCDCQILLGRAQKMDNNHYYVD